MVVPKNEGIVGPEFLQFPNMLSNQQDAFASVYGAT